MAHWQKVFSDVKSLKRIDPQLLKQLLERFTDYLESKGITSLDPLGYEALANILAEPDEATPDELLDMLHCVSEMATEANAEKLQKELSDSSTIKLSAKLVPIDIALLCRLYEPDVFERIYMFSQFERKRSFQYFKGSSSSVFVSPTDDSLNLLKTELENWCKNSNKNGHVRCLMKITENKIFRFLIFYSTYLKREPSITENGKSESIHYYPEKVDSIIFNRETNRLQIKPESEAKALFELYKQIIGKICFNDPDYFQEFQPIFTLEPLHNLMVLDYDWTQTEGIDKVELSEVQFKHNGGILEIRKTPGDYFPYLIQHCRETPTPQIISATFKLWFTHSKRYRKVTLKPPNKAVFLRDEDSLIVEDWLLTHGFTHRN